MNKFNYQNKNKYHNKRAKKEKENKFLDALVYFIVIITMVMISPLIYKFANDYTNNRTSAPGDNEIVSERNLKSRKYTVSENAVDLAVLRNTEFGNLSLITAKIADSGDVIFFCSSREAKNTGDSGTGVQVQTQTEYEDVFRIASIKSNKNKNNININDQIPPIDGETVPDDTGHTDGGAARSDYADSVISISRTVSSRYNFLDSVQNKNYVYKDYSDGTFFLSNSKTALLFDINRMKITSNFPYPSNYHIYETALSNNKEWLALAAEEGFFVGNLREAYNMTLTKSDMKELIATVKVSGTKRSARYPSWSGDDQLIYYKLYEDDYMKSAGVTTTSPGGNEQLSSLDCKTFIFLNNDSIFYYFASTGETNLNHTFRCGYFNINDRKMTDVMKSQVNYYDINVSPKGRHLAALSRNGNMIKISIIDIPTKKLIYSSLYSDIYDFSFSPDEKNIIIYGRADGRRSLKVINIDWAEE